MLIDAHIGVEWTSVLSLPFAALRWAAILLLVAQASKRRSLAVWVLVGMLAGGECGHDWPAIAVHLQVLGIVFLRLVKVIIAPLIFGTLVVGIAGNGDLKKLGRMGVKTLDNFEIFSTLALIIGFISISVSRAGATAFSWRSYR